MLAARGYGIAGCVLTGRRRAAGPACLALGRDTVTLVVSSLLDSLQSAAINRDLALQLLDLLLLELVPDLGAPG